MEAEAELFKALGEPTRLRLVTLLAVEGEVCVCKLAEALDEPDFKVSRHLGVLRSAGVVESRRAGTWMHYRLVDPGNWFEEHIHECLRDCLLDHRTVKRDLKRLSKASCQPARR
jgi:ArsR family transcriptional regulator